MREVRQACTPTTMANPTEPQFFSSFSNECARLVYDELQRLRNELAAAEQRAKTAERKGELERTKRQKAEERAESLQKEFEVRVSFPFFVDTSHSILPFRALKKKLRVESIDSRKTLKLLRGLHPIRFPVHFLVLLSSIQI